MDSAKRIASPAALELGPTGTAVRLLKDVKELIFRVPGTSAHCILSLRRFKEHKFGGWQVDRRPSSLRRPVHVGLGRLPPYKLCLHGVFL